MPGSLVILTGAGVSAESGLGTFRDTEGLWAKFDWRELATPEGFARMPDKVHAFYNARREGLRDAQPNAAHHALVELEKAWLARGGEFLLVTQNIDDLHDRAGSERLIHMHGELNKMRCTHCGSVDLAPDALSLSDHCKVCGETGGLRPHVVWFGEMPLMMDAIYAALNSATHFAAIGTSATVYPAAGFCEIAANVGARLIELNLEETEASSIFHETRKGLSTQTVPDWVAEIVG